jgi:hypothetical protein
MSRRLSGSGATISNSPGLLTTVVNTGCVRIGLEAHERQTWFVLRVAAALQAGTRA